MGTTDTKVNIANQSNLLMLLVGLLLMAGTFIIDIKLPLGVAGGVPYVAVILTSLWLKNYKFTLFFAISCSLLTLLGLYLSPDGGELWKVLVNRALALFAIWVTAILTIKWKTSQERLLCFTYESEKEKEKEKIYLATLHGAQHITNNLLNQLKLVKMEIKNHPDFNKDISRLFGNMLAESNDLLTKLSSVKEIDAKKIELSVHPEIKT